MLSQGFLYIHTYDYLFIIICREFSLEAAARRPLLTGHRFYQQVDPSELYPHVYDSLAKAKLTSAFVADNKVHIRCMYILSYG